MGGALAGSATACLLRRKNPQLRILILERSERLKRRVGESTVEISAYFLGRVLGFTDHLLEKHIPKQGMRFWFSNDQARALDQCSETGPRYNVRLPGYQVDRAVLDADRFLYIRGRADNAIIRGGFKIHPDDVVRAINDHPAVREAAVVGVPDARLGAVPAAAIILKDGAAEPEVDVLKTWLRERLIAYQVPVHIRYVADFPRTPSMKPSAPGLQSLFEGAS